MRADDTQRLEDSATRLEVTGGDASVRVVVGANEGVVCLLTRNGLLLGRGNRSPRATDGSDGAIAELLLDDPWVSRRHARLQERRGEWELTDLGSRNRAYVDGAPLGEEQTRPLVDGSLIRLGETLLVFRVRTAAREAQSLARSAYAARSVPAGRPREVHLSSGWTVAQRVQGEAPFAGFAGFPGCAPAARAVRRRLVQLARASGHVLVLGETGTGKEQVARALALPEQPFVPQNCAELTRELARSELFGHLRGAFSGAVTVKTGLVDVAERGVLFLDEIGELPLDVQAELLRFLEDGGYRPVGSTELRRSNARVVAATNADLDAAVRAGKFRLDLLARLRASNPPLELPPLRERREDILDWAAYFFREAVQESAEHGDGRERVEGRERSDVWTHRNAGTAECLLLYPWPGNLRELRGVMRGVAAAGLDLALRPEQLPRALREHRRTQRGIGEPGAPLAEPSLAPGTAPTYATSGAPGEGNELAESSESTDSLQPAMTSSTASNAPSAPLLVLPESTPAMVIAIPAPAPTAPGAVPDEPLCAEGAGESAAPIATIEAVAPFVSVLPRGLMAPTASAVPRAPIAPPVQPTAVTPLSAIKELSEELTRDVIEAALTSTSGSIRATANQLGIERRKLYRLCERLGIDLDQYRASPKKE